MLATMAPRKPPAKIHQVNVRLGTASWLRLCALVGYFGRTQTQVIDDALARYYEQLSPSDRQAVDQGVKRRQQS